MLKTTEKRSDNVSRRSIFITDAWTKLCWIKAIEGPLLISLLFAVVIRAWLAVHTHGVIAGDEAMVGLQAEHILRGEHPIYYYGQPYMASFEAYFLAAIFLLTSPSAWAMRTEPILIALVLVYLTWSFAKALANAARLSLHAKFIFVTVATLIAAFPPLYDVVEEMRATGGYIEVFTIMLWLLFCAWSVAHRWREGASWRELVLRWAGLGFLIGFGLWIDPLVAYALVTIALWLGGFFIIELIRPRCENGVHPKLMLCREALLAVAAIPAALIGFAPGLYWGAHHHWENITYVLSNGSSVPQQNKLHTILQVQYLYTTCLAPRALGGSLPTQPGVTSVNPHIVTFGLVVGTLCLFLSAAMIILSFICPKTLLVCIRQLTALPLLFGLCTSAIFCFASISVAALQSGCGPWDIIGRYVVPLVVALPFFIAAIFTIPILIIDSTSLFPTRRAGVFTTQVGELRQPVVQVSSSYLSLLWRVTSGFLALVLLAYFYRQSAAYWHADPGYTFQESGCVTAYPADNGPIIAYMQREHIRYAWGTGWIADPITFKTNGAVIVSEPHGRIAANNDAVARADRPSLLLLAQHSDAHPSFLRALDGKHIAYRVKRFYSEPGVDALVITPLDRTLSPSDPAFADLFNAVFRGCL